MNTRTFFFILILLVPFTGCVNCPVVEEQLANSQDWKLGRGQYHAKQIGNTVKVFAEGANPTPNYQNIIAKTSLTVFPPELVLQQKAPSENQIEKITPFKICRRFTVAQKIAKVTIRDADGKHEVNVEH